MHKSNRKVAILSSVNIKHMSMITIYTEILKRNNISFDIIYMDKYDEEEEFECRKKYRYVNRINRNWPNAIKRIKYMMFVPYATRILKQNDYDFVIVWNDLAIFMFANFLSKHLKNKYCLNVRDNMYYDKKIFRRMYKKCFTNSAFNTISSKGYLDFLPKDADYIQIHSLNTAILSGMKTRSGLRSMKEPIRIGFIGYVRYFERNQHMLQVFANDNRFEMHYYGKDANVLKKYATTNKITNCVFHDSFPVHETKKYLEKIDIINNLYGNDTLNVQKAISIKFYHALYARIPILVNTNTYVGELANSLGIGFYVTDINSTMKDELFTWYHGLDFQALNNASNNYLEKVLVENKKFESLFEEVVCKDRKTIEVK
jgi:hypothetical protein